MSRKASTASPKPATATRTLDRSRDAFASGQRTNARPSRASSQPELAASVGISGDSFNAETWLPPNRSRFRLDEFAKLLRCSIKAAARKFRNRSLGGGRKLRLASGSMRRAWDLWRKGGRVSSAFRLHYRAGKRRHAIDTALLRLVALDCVNGGRTLAEVLRTTHIASRAGASVSARTIYRRLPARTLQQLGTQRRISRERSAIRRGTRSVLKSLGEINAHREAFR